MTNELALFFFFDKNISGVLSSVWHIKKHHVTDCVTTASLNFRHCIQVICLRVPHYKSIFRLSLLSNVQGAVNWFPRIKWDDTEDLSNAYTLVSIFQNTQLCFVQTIFYTKHKIRQCLCYYPFYDYCYC